VVDLQSFAKVVHHNFVVEELQSFTMASLRNFIEVDITAVVKRLVIVIDIVDSCPFTYFAS
jgi:hypothetical protein